MTDWTAMATLLAGIPHLPGARCKGSADLFEATIRAGTSVRAPAIREIDEARAVALRICAACPALGPCRDWLDAQLPTRRPRGVVAGRVVDSTHP